MYNMPNAIELIQIKEIEIMEMKRASHTGRPSHLSPEVHGRLHS